MNLTSRMRTFSRRPQWSSRIAAALFVSAMLAVAGCNIVAPIAYAIEGPPKVAAEHRLADIPTVVFVDDRKNILTRTALRNTIGDTVAQTLMQQKLVTRTFSTGDAVAIARRQESERALMPMDAIGRAVGAEQVIYVNIIMFGLTSDGFSPRPTAVAEIRVIDVEGRQRTFPVGGLDSSGRPVEASLREINPDVLRTQASRRAVEDRLAQALGIQIARLFFEHERINLGENLGVR